MAQAEMPLLSVRDASRCQENRANNDKFGNYADRVGPRGKEWHRQRKGARGAKKSAGPGFAVDV